MKVLFLCATSITLALFAGLLALKHQGGWGWFLFGSMLTVVSYESESKKK
jgi:hypothetical protein